MSRPLEQGGTGVSSASHVMKINYLSPPTTSKIALSGKSVSSPLIKNILIYRIPKSDACLHSSRSSRGRLAIVTNAERDAVDVDALLTNSADADGEVVWS